MAPIEEAGAFWVLDPTSGVWIQVKPADSQAPYLAGCSYHALTRDGKDTIFLHAGCPARGRLNDLWTFPLPEPAEVERRLHTQRGSFIV